MPRNSIEAITALRELNLARNDLAFLFLGYSSILLKSNDLIIAIDPGKSLSSPEISVIGHLDLLLFTHNHWDHFKKDHALELIKQTQPHVVADVASFEELKPHIPSNTLTRADPASKSATFCIDAAEVTALPGIHVGPITQYLINLGTAKIFHGGDSGYWRQKNASADIALVPVGTATTCSPATALATVMDLSPRIAVPIHGRKQEMTQFKSIMEKILPETEVIKPEKYKPIRIHDLRKKKEERGVSEFLF